MTDMPLLCHGCQHVNGVSKVNYKFNYKNFTNCCHQSQKKEFKVFKHIVVKLEVVLAFSFEGLKAHLHLPW